MRSIRTLLGDIMVRTKCPECGSEDRYYEGEVQLDDVAVKTDAYGTLINRQEVENSVLTVNEVLDQYLEEYGNCNECGHIWVAFEEDEEDG